jgi:phosphoenolpyruvate carboxykinase (GTP)
LKVGAGPGKKMPKIFYVNWFRKDEKGFLWPGYGENSRVLKWVFERCNGMATAIDTAIGRLPAPTDIDINGLDVSPETMQKLLTVDKEGWKAEVPLIREFFAKFGSRMPAALQEEANQLEQRLK